MSDYMKQPCAHCPYRRDVKPYLTPERGEELAYIAHNQYNSFPCHKTTSFNDESEQVYTGEEKECAGFLTLVATETGCIPEGFKPSYELVYSDSWEMVDAYDNPSQP